MATPFDRSYKNWMSVSALIRKHGGNYDKWKSQLEAYHDTNPKWWVFGKKSIAPQACFYYHPTLVAKVMKKYTPR